MLKSQIIQQIYKILFQDQQFINKMRSPGILGGDITNRMATTSFSRPCLTPGRNYKDDVSHTTFGQLQNILEKERSKFRDSKQKMEAELDNERKLRIEFENKLIKIKDQFSRKDVELSEFQFRQNNILHQVQDYQIQNQRLKTQLLRLQDLYGNRIYELENQLNTDRKSHDETLQEYKAQFQKFKKQGLQYIETLNFEHDRKVKTLEDKCKELENIKRQVTTQNKKLNDLLVQNKLNFQQELRGVSNRLREQELRKSQLMAKAFDQRLKSAEQAKESISRRVQDLSRQIQDKDRQRQQLENQKNDEIQRMRLQNSDIASKYAQMNFLYEKVKNQLLQKQAVMNRNTGESSHQVGYLKQQIQQKRKQIQLLNSTIRQLRQGLKEQAGDFERKRAEVQDKCSFYESQARRYREQNTKIYQTLKAKINQTITNVGTKR